MRRFLRDLARFLRSTPLDPTVVRLRTKAPTVTREETAKLGPRWVEPKLQTAEEIAAEIEKARLDLFFYGRSVLMADELEVRRLSPWPCSDIDQGKVLRAAGLLSGVVWSPPSKRWFLDDDVPRAPGHIPDDLPIG